MLTARLSNGNVIILSKQYSRDYLLKLRRQEKIYCRECGARVILKAGTKKIPHFAHEKGSDCSSRYERESEYHLEGKLQLYEWLQKQNLSPQLEVYFPEIQQRSDILFEFAGKRYALEYQCTPISEDEFLQRTKGYERLAIHPLWVLGGKSLQRQTSDRFSLSAFQFLFLQKTSSNHLYLPAFCPEINQLILLTNIMPVSVRTTLAKVMTKPLSQASVAELIDPVPEPVYSLQRWRKEMKQYRSTLLRGKHLFNSPFVKELYSRSVHPLLMPPYVGIPLSLNPVIEESPYIWQTYFFIDCLLGRKAGDAISFIHAYLTFQKRIEKQYIRLRPLPHLKKSLLPFVISEYLHCLVEIGVLKQIGRDRLSVVYDIVVPKNFGERDRAEEGFYRQFVFDGSFSGKEFF